LVRREKVALRQGQTGVERLVALREGTRTQFFYEKGTEIRFQPEIHRKFSVLTHLPILNEFPAATWLKELLSEGVHQVRLKVEELRAPSPPYKGKAKSLDGAHLARFVARLKDESPELFEDWVEHLRTALPDLEMVRTVLRPEDRHRYLMLRYTNGVEVPSWVVSDGTLRLMALTVLAYMPDSTGLYLIEEPEDGLHPTAIETVHQSLTSLYQGQVLVATHSPVLLSLAKPEDILCCSKTPEGTQIVSGEVHPALRDWKGEVNLSDLFAAGVLG
jgi:hypothetical protein